ncbi:hypothetical protein ACM66B_001506 [Microbotryomycetes sp. NB124-2]
MSNFRGRGRGRGGAAQQQPPSARGDTAASSLDDSTKQAKQRFSKQLSQAKELFPDWSDEDLLSAIQEANGDAELAILRISEGHAQQWGAVTKKKTPKPSAPSSTHHPQSTTSTAGRGGFAGRGRGGFESGRGGRGGGRGGRGGRGGAAAANGTQRSAYTDGAASSATPDSFVDAQQQQESSPAAPKPVAPTWVSAPVAAAEPRTESAPAAPAAAEDGRGSTTAATEATQVNGASEEPAAAAPANDSWAAPAEQKQKPASKTIAPGSTRSWAQIARPPSPPKPAPAPPAPKQDAAPAPEPAQAAEEQAVASAKSAPAEQATAPVINLPSSTNATASSEQQQTKSTGAWGAPASTDPWGAQPSPAPLAPGEGWADVVSATKDTEAPFAQQAASEAKAHMPPNDINAAGPIEVSSNAAAPQAQAASGAAQEQAPAQDKPLGPPGFPPKREAVVMPGASGGDRPVDVQFGSLSLYDSQSSFKQDTPAAQDAQRAPEQTGFSQQPQHQQYDQASQSAFGQVPNAFSQTNNAFSRYPNTTAAPYSQFQQQTQPQQSQQQAQQQADDHSSYAGFKPDAVSSPYYQHPGVASHSPAPAQAAQGYGAFGSAPQQAPGQPGPFGSTQSDYSALYGQDALRNMGFYDQYGQSGAFGQAPSTASRSDDPASSASHTPAPANSQTPGQQQQQQQQQQLPGQQQHPYMMHYGYPQGYGYYGGYGQGYQQVPPNFQALQQQYNASPYYQQQQYGSRNFAPQGAQPGQVGQGYRQQNVAAQGAYGAQTGAQAQAYGQYGQQQQRDTRDQKDLDRSSFGAFY